jgi:hypothetical protein
MEPMVSFEADEIRVTVHSIVMRRMEVHGKR